MRPQFYADLCRQYATYLRAYDEARQPYRIASGANADDYHWTRVLMEIAGGFVDAVSRARTPAGGTAPGIRGCRRSCPP